MRPLESLRFCLQSLRGAPFRSAMVLLAITLGVAAVVALTALGEGARRYVLGEFAFLGKDVLVMFPGRNETTGGMPPVMGNAARQITLQDVSILQQRVTAIARVAPLVVGSAEVSFAGRARQVTVLGSSADFVTVRQLQLGLGRNLQGRDIRRASDECLIGATLRTQLLGTTPPIGALLRVADYRCRVVGVLAGRGDAFGMDLSDALVIPVAAAQRIFNVEGLFRVLIQIRPGYGMDGTRQQIGQVMQLLHQGEEDVTLVSPDALLTTFDGIFDAMTLGVAAIGGISLLVSGLLIMNITVIGISQRTEEIGLLKALGADAGVVQRLFVLEAVLLAGAGAVLGLVCGQLLVLLGRQWLAVDFVAPLWAQVAGFVVAVGSGLLFAWLPARRASQLLPLAALQRR